MTRVYVASPFRGANREETRQNIVYARLCMLDSLGRGESPYLSHLLITQVFAETPELREVGLGAGDAWRDAAQIVAAYTDLGTTPGMNRALLAAAHRNTASATRLVTLSKGETPTTPEAWRAYLATVPLVGFPELHR